MNIGIIVPTYNENENIVDLINKISLNLSNEKVDYNIFIIDDSIEDTISKLIKPFQNKVRYFHRGKKLGRGSAVILGMDHVLKTKYTDLIIEMDADLSHDPSELSQKISLFSQNKFDLLISSRYLSQSKIEGWPISRKIFSFLSNKLTRFLLSVPVSDYTNGYRFYSTRAASFIIKNCGKIGDGFIVLSEILLELHFNNFKVGETYSRFKDRERGLSKVNMRLVISSLIGLFKLFIIKIRKY